MSQTIFHQVNQYFFSVFYHIDRVFYKGTNVKIFSVRSYIPRHRLESVIAKYSKHPHPRWSRADAQPQRKENNSEHSCNSRLLNRDGDKEAKHTDCSFNHSTCAILFTQHFNNFVFKYKVMQLRKFLYTFFTSLVKISIHNGKQNGNNELVFF